MTIFNADNDNGGTRHFAPDQIAQMQAAIEEKRRVELGLVSANNAPDVALGRVTSRDRRIGRFVGGLAGVLSLAGLASGGLLIGSAQTSDRPELGSGSVIDTGDYTPAGQAGNSEMSVTTGEQTTITISHPESGGISMTFPDTSSSSVPDTLPPTTDTMPSSSTVPPPTPETTFSTPPSTELATAVTTARTTTTAAAPSTTRPASTSITSTPSSPTMGLPTTTSARPTTVTMPPTTTPSPTESIPDVTVAQVTLAPPTT